MATKVEREIARDKKLNEAVEKINEAIEKLDKVLEVIGEPKKGKTTKKTS